MSLGNLDAAMAVTEALRALTTSRLHEQRAKKGATTTNFDASQRHGNLGTSGCADGEIEHKMML